MPAAERVEQVAPGAAELAGALGARLQTPGARAALVVGGVTFVAALIAGFLLALLPDSVLIGTLNPDTGYFSEALRLTVGTTLGSLRGDESGTSYQLLPLLAAVIPFAAAFLAARLASPSLGGMRERDAVLWSASGAIIFAVGALIVALVSTGSIQDKFEGGASFNGLSVAFGAVALAGTGAALGALLGGRAAAPDRPREAPSPTVTHVGRALAGPLRGFAVLLAVMTVIALVNNVVATVDGRRSLGGNSVGASLVDTVAFSLDSGVNHAALSAFAEFHGEPALSLAEGKDLDSALDDKGRGRIFALTDGFPALWFIPLLLVSIAAFLLMALYSGFASARRMATPTQAVAIGYGALTGIVWAIGLVILRAAGVFDAMVGSSVFASVLLVGTAVGALGGALAFRPRERTVASAPAPGGVS